MYLLPRAVAPSAICDILENAACMTVVQHTLMEHENSQIEMASFQCEESVSDLRRSFRDTLQVKGNESGLPIVILKFRGVSRELCQDVLRR